VEDRGHKKLELKNDKNYFKGKNAAPKRIRIHAAKGREMDGKR
jgi:hypothetical protein